MRDPDAAHRGVGAIAASDGVASRTRGRRRAIAARASRALDRRRAALTLGPRGGVGDDLGSGVVCGYAADGRPLTASSFDQCPPTAGPTMRTTMTAPHRPGTPTPVTTVSPGLLAATLGRRTVSIGGQGTRTPGGVSGGGLVVTPTSSTSPTFGTGTHITAPGGGGGAAGPSRPNPITGYVPGSSTVDPNAGSSGTTNLPGASAGASVSSYVGPASPDGSGGGVVTGVIQPINVGPQLPDTPDLPAGPSDSSSGSSGSFLDSIPTWAKVGGVALAAYLLLKGRS